MTPGTKPATTAKRTDLHGAGAAQSMVVVPTRSTAKARPRRAIGRALPRLCTSVIVGALQLCLLAGGVARANPHLAEAQRLLDKFRDRAALVALERARRWEGNTDKLRAQIHVYRGIAFFNLLADERARDAFRRALETDPEVALPISVSPKIRHLFDEVRESMPPPAAAPPPRRAPADGASTPRPLPPPTPSHGVSWPAWLGAGVTIASLGAGIALGVAAEGAEEDAADLERTYADARSRHDDAKGLAIGANVLYALAGAAGVATVIWLWYSHRGEAPRAAAQTAAAIVPTRGGMMLQIGNVRW